MLSCFISSSVRLLVITVLHSIVRHGCETPVGTLRNVFEVSVGAKVFALETK